MSPFSLTAGRAPALPASSREALLELAAHSGYLMPHALTGSAAATPPEAQEVAAFWWDAGPALWFAKDPTFDRSFRERFLTRYEAASGGELRHWLATATGALALLLLLDQFPRNAFRGTSRMYATDAMARGAAADALDAGHDQAFAPDLRVFFYLPFGHSENLADQERSVALAAQLGEPSISHAKRHHGIIARFGRFPHRNPILGRSMTAEEQRYLDEGGFQG
jgi:uncharacterized protein (DUF924 family)